MRVLSVDVGGTHVKVLATGQDSPRQFSSGPTLTADQMVTGVTAVAAGWKYDAVSVGYPGPVLHGRPVAEPPHLGPGWVGFDYQTAFGRPVKLVNDAAMQARGSYRGGKMLFLGLGTGLGSTLIVDGIVEPMELGHLPYRNGTFEEYVGLHGLQVHGLTQWRRDVEDVVSRLVAALEPEDVVLGGGNVHQLDTLPPGWGQATREAIETVSDQPVTNLVSQTAGNPPLVTPLSFTGAAGSIRLDNALTVAQASGLAPLSVDDSFRNPRLHLAHEIGPHVGGLGVDAAAELREQRHE